MELRTEFNIGDYVYCIHNGRTLKTYIVGINFDVRERMKTLTYRLRSNKPEYYNGVQYDFFHKKEHELYRSVDDIVNNVIEVNTNITDEA